MKRILTGQVMALATGALLCSATVTPANAAETLLKFSTMEGPADPMAVCFTLPLLAELEEAGGGALEIETYMGGSGFANPVRQYEQVARGIMDISQGALTFTPGQFEVTEVMTMPLLVDDAEEMSRVANRLAPEYLGEEFADIHLMGLLMTPSLYIHMREPVTSLDDLKGKRIRSTGVGAAAFLEGLGAIPVQMPTPSVYENLQTGTLDGSLSESLALKSFRISEVAEHHLLVNVTSAPMFIGMNKRTLDSLPDDLREFVETRLSGPEVGAKASACWKSYGAEVVEELKAQGQVFTELSPEDAAGPRKSPPR